MKIRTQALLLGAGIAVLLAGRLITYDASSPPSETPPPSDEPDAEPAQIGGREPQEPEEIERFNREAVAAQRPVKLVRVGSETIRIIFRRGHAPREDDDEDAAAHALYRSIEECRGAPQSEEELEAVIAQARARFAMSGGAVAGDDGHVHRLEDSVKFLQQWHERCQSITADLPQAREALRRSALRGDAANALAYAKLIEAEKPDEARALYGALWRAGYVAALGGAGVDPLAVRLVELALEIAGLEGRPEPLAADWLAEARAQLTALERSTSPSTYHAAEREAAELLRNPNCCKR